MKLHQLRYLVAVVQQGLNVTAAADVLHTSQPGVSKQIKLLEDELGFQVFKREGRNITRLTAAGKEVFEHAVRVIEEVGNIRRLSADFQNEKRGSMSIATTHTQARYVLPDVIRRFRVHYPEVDLHLHQGTSEQIADLAADDRVDFCDRDRLARTVSQPGPDALLSLAPAISSCRATTRSPAVARPTLQDVSEYPVVTYVFSVTGRSSLADSFERAGLKMNVVLTARDSDVIKTYVRLGLGVGIVACVARTGRARTRDLVAIDGSHLFPEYVTWIGVRRGRLLRGYMYEFMRAVRAAPEAQGRGPGAAGEGCGGGEGDL